jgi:hypothetical protein
VVVAGELVEVVVEEGATVVDGALVVVEGCVFLVVVVVVVVVDFAVLVGLPLLQPAAVAPATTTANTSSPLR